MEINIALIILLLKIHRVTRGKGRDLLSGALPPVIFVQSFKVRQFVSICSSLGVQKHECPVICLSCQSSQTELGERKRHSVKCQRRGCRGEAERGMLQNGEIRQVAGLALLALAK